MSEFTCNIVQVGKIEKHPNADTLSLTEVDGCPVIFRTGSLQTGDTALYVPVEAIIPKGEPEFDFLPFKNGFHRVKAIKLRGIFSMGLLVPFKGSVGENVAERLNITKYEETAFVQDRDSASPPKCRVPHYDLESFRKYHNLFVPGEEVVVTEKLHGANGRILFHEGNLYVGSHGRWRKEEDNSPWWRAVKQLNIVAFIDHLPNVCLFYEVYGWVQDLRYGMNPGQVKPAAFDLFDVKKGKYLDYLNFKDNCASLMVPIVPELYRGPYDPKIIYELAEGQSTLASNIREGVVVKPLVEREDLTVGRVALKLHGQGYLLRKGGTEAK